MWGNRSYLQCIVGFLIFHELLVQRDTEGPGQKECPFTSIVLHLIFSTTTCVSNLSSSWVHRALVLVRLICGSKAGIDWTVHDELFQLSFIPVAIVRPRLIVQTPSIEHLNEFMRGRGYVPIPTIKTDKIEPLAGPLFWTRSPLNNAGHLLLHQKGPLLWKRCSYIYYCSWYIMVYFLTICFNLWTIDPERSNIHTKQPNCMWYLQHSRPCCIGDIDPRRNGF